MWVRQIMVRKCFSLLFVSLAIILLTGCGQTPEQTVASFFQRLKADDLEGAKRYTSAEFGRNLTTTKAFLDLLGIDPFAQGADLFKTDNLRSEINGDTARVWQKDKSFLVFVLVKRDDKWIIDRLDTNLRLPDMGN
jgi:hypothetical protein